MSEGILSNIVALADFGIIGSILGELPSLRIVLEEFYKSATSEKTGGEAINSMGDRHLNTKSNLGEFGQKFAEGTKAGRTTREFMDCKGSTAECLKETVDKMETMEKARATFKIVDWIGAAWNFFTGKNKKA
jgi:hypothetical protein